MRNQTNMKKNRKIPFLNDLIWKRLLAFVVCIGFISSLNAGITNKSSTRISPDTTDSKSIALKQTSLEGTVLDMDGNPLPGASVVIKGTTRGVTTDFDGNFTITAEVGEILEVSYIGMKTQEVVIVNMKPLNISLEADSAQLDEVVIVAYGTQKKSSLTASVASVKGEEIARTPVANISSTLGGRVPGLITRQSSGEPGQDETSVLIRGAGTTGNTAPLVIVDGVPRSYNQIDPQSVESISFLKDAAAVAPYGVAGANGVILVTTKKGTTGKLQLSYNSFYGFQNPTVLPEMVSAIEYVNMRNVAAENGGQQPVYSDFEIQKYADGSDPDIYPDHDVLGEIVNRNAPIMSHSLSMSGGTENLKFFGGIGYLDQKGMWGPTSFKRYNLTSNVSGKVTNSTTFTINLSGRIEERRYPYVGIGGIFQQLYRTPPIAPLTYTNGLWGPYIGRSAYGNIYKSGYNRNTSPVMLTQISLEQQLPIKGLSVRGVFSYDFNDGGGVGTTNIWRTPIPYYGVDNSTTPYTYPEIGSDGPAKPEYSVLVGQRQSFTYQGFLNYAKSFGKSDIGATIVLEARNSKLQSVSASRINYNVNIPELNNGGPAAADKGSNGFSSESKQRGMVFRTTYGFDSKYFLEVSGRYDGHYVFAPGKRWHLFPAFSAGWRLSEESFLKNASWLNNLKIRGSYGESGALPYINGELAPFQYLGSYALYGNSAVLGNSITQGLNATLEPNPDITWETAKKTNVGFDLSIYNGLFHIEADYFYENRSNMLVSPQVLVPSEYGIGIAQQNAGRMKNRGIDITMGSSKSFDNGLRFGLDLNFTYAKNELVEVFENEATKDNPNRTRTGRQLGTQFGYEAIGLFQESDDLNGDGILQISEYPVEQFGILRPGDIQYRDQNGDNKIDGNDEVVIGNPTTPTIIYGFSPSVTYRGFDINFLFQGAAQQSFYLNGQAAYPFSNSGSALKKTLDYWTPENPNASYPRVLATPSANSTPVSSWWIRDGDYLRLKSAQIGYTLPQSLLESIGIQTMRFYLSGQNILTWSKDWKDFDPEISASNGNYYPQQKVITFGTNFTF
ncbi:TonB-linked SusC/RagA family outer membrane protein [Arenibacter algicola]|uniref:TonB-linked SusC/RagA family outer membrane protein n=1 Tax=Arenibacter algicola TaxID=616991 RepID=A0ABY3AFV2_9FLAO